MGPPESVQKRLHLSNINLWQNMIDEILLRMVSKRMVIFNVSQQSDRIGKCCYEGHELRIRLGFCLDFFWRRKSHRKVERP